MAPGPRPPAAMDVPEPPYAPPEPPDLPELSDLTLSLSQCDRALASSSDLATMDDDDMGIQEEPNLAKDSQEMEQILNDLNNTDLGQADLLQAIKTLETGDVLSTGDADSIFPLSGFDMAEPVDSEADAHTTEEKIKATQLQLERRCAFLLRRMRMLQARTLGKRVSEEVAHTFEKAMRGARKDGVGRPMGLKAFLKKVETTSALQASASSRSTSVLGPKYYRAGTSKGDASKSASIAIPSGTLAGLEDTAGALRSHVSAVKHALDSDATASSSGAESNDEAVVYNNPHQQHMPIEKRALWSYQRARASIATRWCWLQAQVQELEYKIRQHTDLHKQVREAKGPVQFEGEPAQPSAYEGLLPGSTLADDDSATETCARHRPLRRDTFKKRKLLQMHNLHIATNKAAKPADVHCSCEHGLESCCVCTGRASPTQPPSEGLARLDPGYHPVLSDFKDISLGLHLGALTSARWFRARAAGAWRGAHHQAPRPEPRPERTPPKPRRPIRLKRGRPPLSRRMKERKQSDENVTSTYERSRGRGSTEARARAASFDIDNIVIPQSVAAATRPQILTYKEIVTPKWRVMEMSDARLNNGVSKIRRLSLESEEEDISDAAVRARHLRSEARERGRYLGARRGRRAAAAPDAPPPTPPPPPPVPVQEPHETVRPYSPRRFPLPEHTYSDMLASMPHGYRPASPTSPASPSAAGEAGEESPADSPLSPLSPAPYEGDDPDDVEWDPSQEKVEKRKTTFR
ncbi:KAT8 regulatory NSL complex subunit 1 [Cydia amplana]|uniref:KAT8 regulatory NSL complex subunit 1 n=1 Tax=Cydia amplana TaxID=1869771 RepID=UPI002FE69B54